MVLLNSNNIVISTSSPYALDSVTTTNASVYEIKWPVEVNRRRHYYVLLTAQTEYGVVFSDSNKISKNASKYVTLLEKFDECWVYYN